MFIQRFGVSRIDRQTDGRQTVTLRFPLDAASVIRCSRRRQTSQPVPPPGELDETYVSLRLCPFALLCETTKPEVHVLTYLLTYLHT